MPACQNKTFVTQGRFSDIVGYTELLGDDEGEGFSVLKNI
jgi:hypothetical protein